MSGHGQWRPMRQEDIPAVTAISDAAHDRFTEGADVYAQRLALYPQGCLIFEREGRALGYLVSHPWLRRSPVPLGAPIGAIPGDADTFYIHDLALMAETRGRGAGREAVEMLVRHAAASGYVLLSLVAVNGADTFWMAQGFAPMTDDEDIAQKLESYGPGTVFMEREI